MKTTYLSQQPVQSDQTTQQGSLPNSHPSLHLKWETWLPLVCVLLLSIILRLAFFNGLFGSDDFVYLNRAVQISEGIWTSANYNGSLRYGFNIPAGFFIFVFGKNIFSVNLWPLLCSFAEVASIYLFASYIWGRRAALYAGLVLAFMPLHVAVATRIHADPIVSCSLTFSFILFYLAEQRRAPWLYFLTGIAMGFVFWTKELAIITLFPFIIYPLLWRKFDARWIYLISGGLFMLLAHLVLMTLISGDPFHLFRVISYQLSHEIIHKGYGDGSAWYYFRYLFLDIKHTWLAGFFAVAAILFTVLARFRSQNIPIGTTYVIFWLVSLIGFLSFMPISLSPLRFAMKQSNYISLFLAPLALLSGYIIAKLPSRPVGFGLLFITLAGGLLLAGMEQQAYRVFTSNSKAAVKFEKTHPGETIVGSINNSNIANEYAILESDNDLSNRFEFFGDIPGPTKSSKTPFKTGYAVFDPETMLWGSKPINLESPPKCWKEVMPLTPIGFGFGKELLKILQAVTKFLPEKIVQHIDPTIVQLLQPKLATIYKVNMSDLWCSNANGN